MVAESLEEPDENTATTAVTHKRAPPRPIPPTATNTVSTQPNHRGKLLKIILLRIPNQILDFIIFIENLFDSDFQTEVPVSHAHMPTTPSAPNSPPPRIKTKTKKPTRLVTCGSSSGIGPVCFYLGGCTVYTWF